MALFPVGPVNFKSNNKIKYLEISKMTIIESPFLGHILFADFTI